MRERLEQVALVAVVISALTVSGLLVRREFFAPPLRAASVEGVDEGPVENWKRFEAGGGRLGDSTAAASVIVFSDYHCPACRALEGTVDEYLAKHPKGLKVTYRHYPLEAIHPFAFEAAGAAECAGRQGQFASYHRALFAQQATLSPAVWDSLAGVAGVPDRERFRECLTTKAYLAAVRTDMADGDELGIRATPTVVINGRKRVGHMTLEAFEAALAQ